MNVRDFNDYSHSGFEGQTMAEMNIFSTQRHKEKGYV